MKNRKGFTMLECGVIVVIIGILIVILIPAVDKAREENIKIKQKRISGSYQDSYEKALVAVTNRLLNDPKGPLSERDRGKFLGGIANGSGSNLMKHEGVLAAFAMLDWPDAKSAYKLCDTMQMYVGLMETAEEGRHRAFAQKMFTEAQKELNALAPEEPKKTE